MGFINLKKSLNIEKCENIVVGNEVKFDWRSFMDIKYKIIFSVLQI